MLNAVWSYLSKLFSDQFDVALLAASDLPFQAAQALGTSPKLSITTIVTLQSTAIYAG